jgi:sulfur carrier protein
VNVVLNGREAELRERATVADAVELLDLDRGARGIAVAVDAEVVPRGQWPQRELSDGARVEVLTAIQGG